MTARTSIPRPSPPGRLVLLGHPVTHSLSPTFQNTALDAAGIALRYEAVDVAPAGLLPMLDQLRAVGGAGNVTVPHKSVVAGACDLLTDVAREAGAVNTFWHSRNGERVGDNTDVAGAAAELATIPLGIRAGVAPRIALLGAGGAAAAVVLAAACVWPRARIDVWARREEAAAALASRFPESVEVAVTRAAALGDADLVVNATPLGLRHGDALPCELAELRIGAAVYDLVYGADETPWVCGARAAGHDARDGLGMLVEQGAAAFARWFGIEPDRDRMWSAVTARTGRHRATGHPA